MVVEGYVVLVPSQEHGYPYVSESVVVHPWPGKGWRITVSPGDALGSPRLSASRRPRTGFITASLPAFSCAAGAGVGADGSWPAGDPAATVVDIAKWKGSLLSAPCAGELDTGTRAVANRKRASSSMANDQGTEVGDESASNEESACPVPGFG